MHFRKKAFVHVSLCLLLYFVRTVAHAQEHEVSIRGNVTDEWGNPIAKPTVVVYNMDSSFSEKTEGNAGGVFSFYGLNTGTYHISVTASGFRSFQSDNLKFKYGKPLLVSYLLTSNTSSSNDIVVVGYGKQKRATVTGAINQVGSEAIANRPVTNIGQALQGKIPNLNITFADGSLDRGATFNVRGETSINGGSPLVLIDNTPGDINLLNPSDVESVTVLKDAASAAIYGGRAAYGVILVTTKSGKNGNIKMHYSNNFGYSTPTRFPKTVSALEDITLQNEAYKGYSGAYNTSYTQIADYLNARAADPSLPEMGVSSTGSWLYGGNTDWYGAFYNTKQKFSRNNVSFSGGNQNTKYYFSADYLHETGMFKMSPDVLKRYSLNLNVDQRLYSWLHLSDNISMFQSQYNSPNRFTNSSSYTIYRYLSLFANPYYPIYTPNGNFTQAGAYIFGGLTNGSHSNTTSKQIKNMLSLQGSFLNNSLHLNAVYSIVSNPSYNETQNLKTSYEATPGVLSTLGGTDYYKVSNGEDLNQTINLYGDYSYSLNEHNFKLLIGYNQELDQYKYFYASRNGNLASNLPSLDLTDGGTADVYGMGDTKYDVAMRGFFGRLNYDFDQKYLLEFNGRYDGTSRYASERRYGFFPSASVGWVASREPFFKKFISANVVNNFKLRASYGSLGNQYSSSPFPYLQTMTVSRGSYIFNGANAYQTSAPGLTSSNFTWEKVSSIDFGLDVNMLKNRLSIGFDWYNRTTKGMLAASQSLPAVLGTDAPEQNAADLRTKGWELSVGWSDQFKLATAPFKYSVTLVLSDYSASVTKYSNPTKLLTDYYEGQKIGEIWGYKTLGFFKSDDEYASSASQKKVSSIEYSVSGHPLAGDIKFWDKNGDGEIYYGDNTADNSGDKYVIGNSTPRYSFGTNFNFNWSGFDLNIFLQGVLKRDFWPGTEAGVFWGTYNRTNQPVYTTIVNNYWTENHTDAYFPRLRAYIALNSGNSLNQVQTRYLQNAAYVRLKDVSLGYTVNTKKVFSKSAKIPSVRFFFSGQNLTEWTKLNKAFDPEGISTDPDGISSQGSGFLYPINRTYTFGLDINF